MVFTLPQVWKKGCLYVVLTVCVGDIDFTLIVLKPVLNKFFDHICIYLLKLLFKLSLPESLKLSVNSFLEEIFKNRFFPRQGFLIVNEVILAIEKRNLLSRDSKNTFQCRCLMLLICFFLFKLSQLILLLENCRIRNFSRFNSNNTDDVTECFIKIQSDSERLLSGAWISSPKSCLLQWVETQISVDCTF